ncbi:MAG: hypothetical protein A2452_11805 [Candidatus Firestonebacteria bacterium RIFOXYC2_FULL_39_67]|nr:MAG: hypothetical protein A2536_07505 [Candidatus Firestonebacteria bacterium RIFOXYD2_FULL_39_29]OGF51834.1 MAG: hypothetical protein A2497_01935 [Candidatus Firestonebacteria bacterium RifOxyC12_full_39_7]OGF53905.1 MAG: hypothetical protein A2452_11805 [Candidatus Firestonebacteria bacterium RIFOXYC2_FULL_39_67]
MAAYQVGNYEFKLSQFFTKKMFDAITDVRVDSPEVILKEAKERKKRKKITKDGKLTILAADHPGRMVNKNGDDPIAMSDRHQYLGRVLRVITHPDFDGIMATTDVIEDLFIINYLVKKNGGPSFLDDKVMLGSMNRGGLAGTKFEMDDTFTCFSSESLRLLNMDGAKTMLRLDTTSYDSAKTVLYCANMISELNKYEMPTFLEPLFVTSDGFKVQKSLTEMVKIIGVASAMGDSSRNLWLKIPYGENYERVVRATTLPILMLGGESKGDPTGTISEFETGMKAGKNVRGALVGRNILFPGKEDPLAAALAVNKVIHNSFTKDQAVDFLMKNRDINIDVLTKFIK